MVKPAARREAAAYLRQAFQMSERRACRVIGTDRATVRYRALRPDDNALRERLKALAQQRRRFGYRRLHVLLRREGRVANRKRVQRLYREERLSVRRRAHPAPSDYSSRPSDEAPAHSDTMRFRIELASPPAHRLRIPSTIAAASFDG